jgi:hypothetical protein
MKLERKLTTAKKCILDDEMTRLVAYMSLQPSEYFLKNLSSCRLPYDLVWFQWDQHVMLKAYQEEGVPIGSDMAGKKSVAVLRVRGEKQNWISSIQNLSFDDTPSAGGKPAERNTPTLT